MTVEIYHNMRNTTKEHNPFYEIWGFEGHSNMIEKLDGINKMSVTKYEHIIYIKKRHWLFNPKLTSFLKNNAHPSKKLWKLAPHQGQSVNLSRGGFILFDNISPRIVYWKKFKNENCNDGYGKNFRMFWMWCDGKWS